MEKEIIYESECGICDAHKTDLGTLKELWDIIKENFEMNGEHTFQLWLTWFEQYKTDARMKYIEQSKQRTTEQIQKYKQANIKAVKKED